MVGVTMKKFKLLIAFLVVLGLNIWLSCSETNHAGGGVWDEAGNTLAVQVLDTLGQPVSNALLKVVPIQGWTDSIWKDKSPVTDSSRSKSKQTSIKTPSWPLTIEAEWNGLVAQKTLNQAQENLILQLEKPAQIHGNLAQKISNKMYFAHSSHQVQSDAEGKFSSKLPPGEWTLIAQGDSSLLPLINTRVQSGQIEVWEDIEIAEGDSVIIEDFTRGGNANKWHWLTSTGWWFCSVDSSSSINPGNLHDARKPASLSELGVAAHLNFDVGYGGFALCGMDFYESHLADTPNNTVDLSNMDSLSFYAQGQGDFTIQLIVIPPNSADSVRTYATQVHLPSSWERLNLLPSAFSLNGKETTLLETGDLSHINSIIFMTGNTAELWLDHLVLHGVVPQQMFPQLKRP